MKETKNVMYVCAEQVNVILKKGKVSVLNCISPSITKNATFVKSMCYIHDEGEFYIPKYSVGDLISVREPFIIKDGEVIYSADHIGEEIKWKPSAIMKAEQSRINGTVVDVYAMRLHDMKKDDFVLAGFKNKLEFINWWNDYVKKSIRCYPKKKDMFRWEANPLIWVYVVEKNK